MAEGPERPSGGATARPPGGRLPRAWLPGFRLAPVFGVLVLGGAVIRLLGGDALISTNLVYARSVPEEIPGTRTPEDTVRSFYLMLDRGMYEEAWAVAIEPDWAGRALVPYGDAVSAGSLPAEPTPQERFVERLQAELGYGGVWLKLGGVDARRLSEPGPPPAQAPVAGLEVRSTCRVQADGRLLGACTIFAWSKELEVVEVDGGYRVLLEGTKRPGAFFYQEWFSNVQKIGSLRAVTP